VLCRRQDGTEAAGVVTTIRSKSETGATFTRASFVIKIVTVSRLGPSVAWNYVENKKVNKLRKGKMGVLETLS
jgi:hypothetical protein